MSLSKMIRWGLCTAAMSGFTLVFIGLWLPAWDIISLTAFLALAVASAPREGTS